MLRGKYIGPIQILKNQTAILQYDLMNNDNWQSQFDNSDLPHQYTHGWQSMPKEHWEIMKDEYDDGTL